MRDFLLASAAAATLMAGGSSLAQPRQGGPGPGGGGGPGAGQAGPSRPTGSFEASCRNIQVQGPNVTAECRNIHSRYPVSTINFTACRGDLSNQNGVLSCAGASASVPPGQDDGSGGRKKDNGQFGATAGAVLGALTGGANNPSPPPPPQPPPPAYRPDGDYRDHGDPRDQRYGDRGYDPYGPQGWGYGHRPGEWVPIRERDAWLERRIDRAVEDGDMSRREAGDLRRDIARLEGLENRYAHQGMAPWMRSDLDRRFSALSDRVRTPPPPRREDDHGYGQRDNYGR